MRNTLLALLALASAACADTGVDLSVTSDAESAPYVKQAIRTWHLGSCEPSRQIVRVVPRDSEWLTTRADEPLGKVAGITYYHSLRGERWATIYVSSSLGPVEMQRTISHELGHLLQFQLCERYSGHLPAGNLMARSVGTQVDEPTELDVRFVIDCERVTND